jgi:hypothetical protein
LPHLLSSASIDLDQLLFLKDCSIHQEGHQGSFNQVTITEEDSTWARQSRTTDTSQSAEKIRGEMLEQFDSKISTSRNRRVPISPTRASVRGLREASIIFAQ